MANIDDKIVRSIAVPTWMVYGASTLIVVLLGGPIGQVVMISHHVIELQEEMGERKSEIAAIQVKHQDFVSMFNSISKDIQELHRNPQ